MLSSVNNTYKFLIMKTVFGTVTYDLFFFSKEVSLLLHIFRQIIRSMLSMLYILVIYISKCTIFTENT